MTQDHRLKSLCDFYIRHGLAIGALYCIVPVLAWFLEMFVLLPFRGVYVLRLALSLILGGALGAFANHYGLSLWLIKHRSLDGPATARDGAIIGATIGWVCALPVLTALIGTNHPELAKSAIIITWLVSAGVGATVGTIIGHIGNCHIDRVGSTIGGPGR